MSAAPDAVDATTVRADGHGRFVDEPLADGMTRRWRVDEVLWEGRTAFQRMLVARTAHGVSLFCDDERQSTELSQLTYHEAMIVPAFLLAERLDRVLIVGSSEGVVCRMAIEAGATVVDHVDIDAECVRTCAELLPYGYTTDELAAAERAAAADEPGVRVRFDDGFRFVHDAAADPAGPRYDVVVVDLPDEQEGDAQHNRLYGEDYLAACRGVLAPGGVLAFQAGCPTLWRNATLVRSLRRFGAVFPTVAYFGSDEHEWAFLFGRADEVADPTARMVARLATLPYRPRTLDAATVVAAATPPYAVRAQVRSEPWS